MTVFNTLNAEPAGDEVRIASLMGREWLVAPVVLVREGVLNGGFLGFSEIQKSAPGWNGQPVTAPPDEGTEAANLAPSEPSGHPIDGQTQDGRPNFVSANREPFLSDMNVGMVLNVEAVDDLPTPGDEQSERGLVGEAWVDLDRAEAVGANAVEAVERIADSESLDVSTGYFHRPVEVGGSYEGERYAVEQKDLLPDHLALLPNETGACSWSDGCGAPYPAAQREAAQAAADSPFESSGHETSRLAAASASFVERVTSIVTGGDADTETQAAESGDCSPGPCSCGEHTEVDSNALVGEFYTDEDEAARRAEELGCTAESHAHELDGETVYMPCATHEEYTEKVGASDHKDEKPYENTEDDEQATTNTMTPDINSLAERSAFDAETLQEWDEGDLKALADSLDAQDDGDDGDDPATNTDGQNDELLDRVAELERQVEAQNAEKRERLAERVAAHTDHEADDLVDNADEFPTPALETLADSLDTQAGTSQANAAPQGDRVNYLGQAGARATANTDATDHEADAEELAANVGALANMADDGGNA